MNRWDCAFHFLQGAGIGLLVVGCMGVLFAVCIDVKQGVVAAQPQETPPTVNGYQYKLVRMHPDSNWGSPGVTIGIDNFVKDGWEPIKISSGGGSCYVTVLFRRKVE